MPRTWFDIHRKQLWAPRDGKDLGVRVLIDPQTFLRQRTGGISRLFAGLVREFDRTPRLGVDAILPFRRSNNRHAAAELAHRGITASPSWMPRGVLYAPWWVTGNRYPQPLDIVHSTYYSGRFLTSPPGILRVTTVYDMIPEIFAGTDLFTGTHLRKRAYVEAADLVICISEATRQDMLDVYGPTYAEVVVIPLAVSEGFGPHHEQLPGLPLEYVLYVGAREGYKDFSLLPHALALLKDVGMEVPLVVVGKPFTREEQAYLHSLGVGDSTVQVQLADEALQRAYANAMVLVQTSRHEGFGLTPLEGMASGVPVLVARASSMPEVGGDVARYFEPGNTHDLASAIREILDSEALRARLGAEGLVRAAEFTSLRLAERTAHAYRKIMD